MSFLMKADVQEGLAIQLRRIEALGYSPKDKKNPGVRQGFRSP